MVESGSGLNLHISPAHGMEQVARIVREHGLDPAKIRALAQ